jgi:hypothetical protein
MPPRLSFADHAGEVTGYLLRINNLADSLIGDFRTHLIVDPLEVYWSARYITGPATYATA